MKRTISAILAIIMLFSCSVFAQEEHLQVTLLQDHTAEQTSAGGYVTPSAHVLPRQTLLKGYSSYPETYDSRDSGLISAVADQESTDLCWAFTQTAVAEAYVAKAQEAQVDYSENHIKFSTSNTGGNSLGHLRGANEGGNEYISLAYLARGNGFVLESDDPFSAESSSRAIALTDQRYAQGYLEHMKIIEEASVEEAKELIMEYGAAGARMYFDIACFSGRNAYCYSASSVELQPANHMITLIGWDDHYSKDHFNPQMSPKNDGAFIAKNSWGKAFGEQGYFYISYEDAWVLSSVFATAYSTEEAPYNGIRQYDYYGVNGTLGAESDTLVYAAAYDTQDAALLEGIGTYIMNPGTRVEVYVNPYNGSCTDAAKFRRVYTGTFEEGGYYRIPLDTQVPFYGSRFAVAVKIYATAGLPNQTYVPLQLQSGLTGQCEFYADTFYLGTDLSDMESMETIDAELKSYKGALCLKAFTRSDLSVSAENGTVRKEDGAYRVVLAQDTASSALHIRRNGQELPFYINDLCTQVKNDGKVQEGGTYYFKAEDGTHARYSITVERSTLSNQCELLAFGNALWNEEAGAYIANIAADSAFIPEASVSAGASFALYALPEAVGRIGQSITPNLYSTRLQLRVTAEDGFTARDYPLVIYRAPGTLPELRDWDAVSDWALSAMKKTVEYGLFKGDDQGLLNPFDSLSRVEAAVLLLRFGGIEATAVEEGQAPWYSDVELNVWYTNYINAATHTGMINGHTDPGYRCFEPFRAVTREEYAVMMVRLVAYLNGQSEAEFLQAQLPAAREWLQDQSFADLDHVSLWASDHMAVALYLRIFNGSSDFGILQIRPQDPIDRQETAKVLENSLNLVEKF